MNQLFNRVFRGDRILWVVLLLLSLVSMLIVYSATGKLAYREAGGNTMYYLIRQFSFICLGFLVMIFMVNVIPLRLYSWLAPLLLLVTLLALVAAVVQYRLDPSKATPRSLDLGLFSFQPAELAKISLVMYVAKLLGKHQQSEQELKKAFFWCTGATTLVCGIIFYGNVSTSVLIGGSMLVLMFIGRVPLRFLAIPVGSVVLLMLLLYYTADYLPEGAGRVHTFKERINDFIFGDEQQQLGTTQSDYARLAIFEGGVTGKGPGGSEVSNYMEAAYNDFIYAIIVEEYGWFGGFAVAFLFLVMFYRGVVVVKRATRTFPAFLAAGMIVTLIFQAFINMSVSAGVIPVTGQPLPWISVGGTSMVFTAFSFGVILSVSYNSREKTPEALPPVMVNLPEEDQEI
ncbi:MAG: FtsW/RodA/SpoVE family cell cycle protein [Mangrovibacterium sp.]